MSSQFIAMLFLAGLLAPSAGISMPVSSCGPSRPGAAPDSHTGVTGNGLVGCREPSESGAALRHAGFPDVRVGPGDPDISSKRRLAAVATEYIVL